mmetsp:Transcript_7484/g.18100  ORF Transcript_7484/g.18100 Transcript_7484/m.18100 type:complete len:297 (+) Transcript_7484:1496-2386(+)
MMSEEDDCEGAGVAGIATDGGRGTGVPGRLPYAGDAYEDGLLLLRGGASGGRRKWGGSCCSCCSWGVSVALVGSEGAAVVVAVGVLGRLGRRTIWRWRGAVGAADTLVGTFPPSAAPLLSMCVPPSSPPLSPWKLFPRARPSTPTAPMPNRPFPSCSLLPFPLRLRLQACCVGAPPLLPFAINSPPGSDCLPATRNLLSPLKGTPASAAPLLLPLLWSVWLVLTYVVPCAPEPPAAAAAAAVAGVHGSEMVPGVVAVAAHPPPPSQNDPSPAAPFGSRAEHVAGGTAADRCPACLG